MRSGRSCVDFVNTGQWMVLFHAVADVERWLPLVVGVPAVEATSNDVGRVVQLRRAMLECVEATIAGDPLPPAALRRLNAAAALPPLVPQLSTNGDAELLPASVSQVLATLARDLIDLVAGPFADRIRQCASDDCTLYLVDTSRPNQRRWCSMELCGNRSKLRDFRERQRSC